VNRTGAEKERMENWRGASDTRLDNPVRFFNVSARTTIGNVHQ
jgi:hypothetical protein